jgi:hypothetical protein
MATRVQRCETATWWPGVSVVGLGLLATLQLDAVLWRGGLAPIGVAALVAGAIGIPMVNETWRFGPQHASLSNPIGETLILVSVGAAVATVATTGGWVSVVIALLGLPLIALVAKQGGAWTSGIATGLATTWTLGAGLFSWFRYDCLTLLEPSWFAWQEWLPWSLTAGLLLTTAGLGRWAEAPNAIPGHRKVPWATTGLGLLTMVAAAVVAASVAEGSAPRELWLSVCALIAIALSATALHGPKETKRRRLGIGWVATLWFVGPGHQGMDLFFSTLLPLGLAIGIASRTRQTPGLAPLPGLVATGAALAATVLGWPGIPESPWTAASAAATLVGLVWMVGTRVVLVGRAS